MSCAGSRAAGCRRPRSPARRPARWRRGEQGRVGPVRCPRTVPPGGPPYARSALPVRAEGTVVACLYHCRRSCSAATKWYRSSMSAKWWNTSRNDTPARAATALAVGSGSPARRRAMSASATLRRVRRPRARRPSVSSSPASAATSRSTRSSSCLRGSGSARSRPPKPRSPVPPTASEEPGVTGSHLPFSLGIQRQVESCALSCTRTGTPHPRRRNDVVMAQPKGRALRASAEVAGFSGPPPPRLAPHRRRRRGLRPGARSRPTRARRGPLRGRS